MPATNASFETFIFSIREVASVTASARPEAVESEEAAAMLEPGRQFELAKHLALQLFEENMEQSISLLKTWLKQEA